MYDTLKEFLTNYIGTKFSLRKISKHISQTTTQDSVQMILFRKPAKAKMIIPKRQTPNRRISSIALASCFLLIIISIIFESNE